VEILKQAQNSPLPVGEQTAIIHLGVKGLLQSVAVKDIKKFEAKFLETMRTSHKATIDALGAGKYTPAEIEVIEKVGADIAATFSL
jgi:F-type H+-transporting ATPase subunit alpha